MNITIEKQSPTRIVQTSENSWFADFGKAAYGRLEYEFETDVPSQVELVIGEVLFDSTTINRAPGGFRCIKTDVVKLSAGTSHGFMFIKKHRSPYQDSYQRSKVLTPENAGGEIAPFRYAEIHGTIKNVRLTRHALFAPFRNSSSGQGLPGHALLRHVDLQGMLMVLDPDQGAAGVVFPV